MQEEFQMSLDAIVASGVSAYESALEQRRAESSSTADNAGEEAADEDARAQPPNPACRALKNCGPNSMRRSNGCGDGLRPSAM